MKVNLLFFLLLLSFILFGKDFSKYFQLISEIRLNPKTELVGKLFVPGFYRIAVDKVGNIITCDTYSKKVYLFSSKGELKKIVAKTGKGPGEIISPSSIIATENEIIIVDAELRKINFFDTKYNFLNSFFISASHTQPRKVIPHKNALYCTATFEDFQNPGDADLIVKYKRNGQFISSFFPRDEKIAKSALAYEASKTDMVLIKEKIYAIQSGLFRIAILDTLGKIITFFGSPPSYFISLSSKIPSFSELLEMNMKERNKIFNKYKNSFTPIVNIFNIDNFIFIVTLVKDVKFPQDRKYMLEIYDTNGNHINGSIETSFAFITKGVDGYLYFLHNEEITDENTFYTIGKYKFIGN